MAIFTGRALSGAVATTILTAAAVAAGAAAAPRTQQVEFNRDIRPILSAKCFACHGPDSGHRKADLRLDTSEGARAGGAVVPGKPERSALLARVTAKNALVMPPASTGKQLTPAEIELLRRWIAEGAVYQAHWSYLPPRRPTPPTVRRESWARNPIDRFILARIEAANLTPAPEADPVTLIRRLSFDLTGLPPTPEEVEAFVKEWAQETGQGAAGANSRGGATPASRPVGATSPTPPPGAYERLVDRLLASPRFGERMASYWLDLVRYADTVGYHGDQEQHISPYRDWVIKAFNDDMPFDRFTTEQLAGDLLSTPTEDQLIATGYNRVLQTTHEGGAQDKEYLAKYSADRVRNLGGVWLGATTGCAECHNHKYDPYTQKDFYSLAAFFADIEERGAYKGPDATPTLRPPEIEVLSPFDRAEAAAIQQEIGKLQPGAGDARKAALQARLDALLKRKRPTMITRAVAPRTIRVLARGDWMDETGEVVQPAFPAFLSPSHAEPDRRLTRLDLARWLTSPEQPQTSRVFVNRMWYLLFGAGLCRSLEDTGNQGEWPTHPELLDWLAATFAASDPGLRTNSKVETQNPEPNLGWSIKALVRLIVTSAAYRQSSAPSPEALRKDPENRLFTRQGRFRLPAEMVRDNALMVSGLLVERLGGPSARPYQPDGYYALLNFPKRTYQADTDESQYRRGVYVHWQRQYLHPMLRAFDAPSREECTAQRPNTNTPLAALTLLNDPTFVEAARVLAARMLKEGGSDDASRIRWAWRRTLSRDPNKRESAALLRLYRETRAEYQADPAAAKQLLGTGLAPVPPDLDPTELAGWTAVARALLNLSETITRN